MANYYFDTCIWRDFYENRFSKLGKPLGKYAADLFMKVVKRKDILFYSDLNIKELKIDYYEKEVTDMLNFLFLTSILQKVEMNSEDYVEAKKLAKARHVPTADAMHAILSRNNNAIFVSQDKHAQKLKDVVDVKKPERVD